MMVKNSMPPGYRFHPTDVELVWYYLKRKIMGKPSRYKDTIAEVELYKFSPWELAEKSCLQSKDLEWYFLCPRNKKYTHGSRTNRATDIGYWKPTGQDRSIVHKSKTVGKKKTLIFHTGKSPAGNRTDWVMYEFRLESDELANAGYKQDAYAVCKIFKKSGQGPKNGEQYGAPFNEEDWESDEDDAFINNEDSLPIIPSGQQDPMFNPVPLQYIAPEAGATQSMPPNIEAGKLCTIPELSRTEIRTTIQDPSEVESSNVPGHSGTGELSSMQNHSEVEAPSIVPESHYDGILYEHLEAFLNSSPSHQGNANPGPKTPNSAIPPVNAVQEPGSDFGDMDADLESLCAQLLMEPNDGITLSDVIGPDYHELQWGAEYANEQHMDLSDLGFANGGGSLAPVAPHFPNASFGTNYSDSLVDSYLFSDPQPLNGINSGFRCLSFPNCRCCK